MALAAFGEPATDRPRAANAWPMTLAKSPPRWRSSSPSGDRGRSLLDAVGGQRDQVAAAVRRRVGAGRLREDQRLGRSDGAGRPKPWRCSRHLRRHRVADLADDAVVAADGLDRERRVDGEAVVVEASGHEVRVVHQPVGELAATSQLEASPAGVTADAGAAPTRATVVAASAVAVASAAARVARWSRVFTVFLPAAERVGPEPERARC